MKDKKRVLQIILITILIIATILAVVLIVGGLQNKKLIDYQTKLEAAACKMADEENYTEAICEGFENLCKVHFDKLINRDYIDGSLKNPITKKAISDDTKSYVQVKFKDENMVCTYKEGN